MRKDRLFTIKQRLPGTTHLVPSGIAVARARIRDAGGAIRLERTHLELELLWQEHIVAVEVLEEFSGRSLAARFTG